MPDPDQISRSVKIPNRSQPGLFRSIWTHPPAQTYASLEKDEKPILMINQHWVTRFFRIIVGVVLGVAPPLIAPYLIALNPTPVVTWYTLIIAWFWVTFVILYFVAMFVLWKSDVWLITNERIINFDTNLLFRRKAKDSEIGYIHEIDFQRPEGLLRGTFEYGTVKAKVSGDAFEIVMPHIPQPEKVGLVLGELAEAARQSAGRDPFRYYGGLLPKG